MSFIVFDYRCEECGTIHESKMVLRREMGAQRCNEGKCRGRLLRLPAGPTTTFKFGDRSALKSKKAVSLRDPNPGVTRKMRVEDV